MQSLTSCPCLPLAAPHPHPPSLPTDPSSLPAHSTACPRSRTSSPCGRRAPSPSSTRADRRTCRRRCTRRASSTSRSVRPGVMGSGVISYGLRGLRKYAPTSHACIGLAIAVMVDGSNTPETRAERGGGVPSPFLLGKIARSHRYGLRVKRRVAALKGLQCLTHLDCITSRHLRSLRRRSGCALL